MSGWGGHLDDLADATAQLLANGSVHVEPMVNAQAALAARDAVVTELRTLIGAVISAPATVEVGELTMSDVTRRPALALHQALSELPRVVAFATGPGAGELAEASLPDYERAWQAARLATIGLEDYVGRLGQLGEVHGWDVLRDLTDLAAAVPYLDRDLSQAILPQLKAGEDLALPYHHLTSERHDAVRIVAAEIRARVPAAAPSGSAVAGWSQDGELVAAAAGQPVVDLGEAMVRYTYAVGARSSLVSMPEVKAAARLLQDGSRHAAAVLERVAPAVAGAGEAAQLLRAVASDATRLFDAPGRSMSPPRTDLMGAGNDLRDRVSMLAEIAHRLPGGAAAQDLRRLAAPAVAFAQQVPALAGALDLSVRQAIGARVMLVPAAVDEHKPTTLAWVTASMVDQKRRGEPTQIAAAAGQLSMTTRRLAPAVATAGRRPHPARAGEAGPAADCTDHRPAPRRRGPQRSADCLEQPHRWAAGTAERSVASPPTRRPPTTTVRAEAITNPTRCEPTGYHQVMVVPGPTTQQHTERLAGNMLRLARQRRGWTQRQLATAAGVPVSTVARIESGTRQPSLVTISRLLAAADLELRARLEAYDDHDDVLDARRAALTDPQRTQADQAFAQTSEVLAEARRRTART